MPISETPHPCTSSAHPFGQIVILLCYFCITAKKMPCPQNTPLFHNSCITVDQPLRLERYTLGLLLVYRKCQGESATMWTFQRRARCQFVCHGAHFRESHAPFGIRWLQLQPLFPYAGFCLCGSLVGYHGSQPAGQAHDHIGFHNEGSIATSTIQRKRMDDLFGT